VWHNRRMQILDLTLTTVAENLALDEALLDELDTSPDASETLRLWSPPSLAVVMGRSSRRAEEVRCDLCRQRGIPVARRSSGGAAIVTGPGCLMYAVTLDLRRRPQLRRVESAHRFVLGALAASLVSDAATILPVARRGLSDLAIGDRKFSGNSLHVKREALLYHGTLLFDFPLDEIERLLAMPPRWPDYRESRRHGEFVTNLPYDEVELRRRVAAAWGAADERADWPAAATARLVTERYDRAAWHEAL
jgi:lipoate---protein ligase